MKAFNAFMKPFEAPQRSVKVKISFDFSLCPVLGREGLRLFKRYNLTFRVMQDTHMLRNIVQHILYCK